MLQTIGRLFRATPVHCLICGREVREDGGTSALPVHHRQVRAVLRQLCLACEEAVPWITSAVCRICGRPEACPDCIRRKARQVRFTRCAVRYDATMREWLAGYKYRGDERLEPLLSAMLACGYERLLDGLANAFQPDAASVITAVPLAGERMAERGFNQAECMARQLAGWYGIPYVALLRRKRHTERQSLKSRDRRLADMIDNFAADNAAIHKLRALAHRMRRDIRIVLVDDIYTTGSTMNACAAALVEAWNMEEVAQSASRHCKLAVYGLAWARS